MSDSQNVPEENNNEIQQVQENKYDSLGMWFSVGTDTPLPLRALLYTINSEKNGNDKLSDEELEQILTFVEMMSEKAPNMNVEITPLVYFIKHLNRTKDITKPESEEENEEVLEELSEDESEEVEEEEEDKEEVKEEEEDEEESSEEEEDEDEEDEEDEEESDTDKQFMYNKDMPTVLISNNHIDIPFPITCTFTVLMTLYSIQLGLLFCRLIGCNYLEHSHDEL